MEYRPYKPYLTAVEKRERDVKVLKYINWYWERYGFPPGYRSIAKALGISSSSTIHGIISRLERQKRIVRDPVHNQIRVVNNGDRETCFHDWRVRTIANSLIQIVCADCEHRTEVEYAPTPETPLKNLLKYTGGV